MTMTTERFLTPEQASEKLPFGNAAWVRMQLRAGRLRGCKVSGRWVVGDQEVTGDEAIAAMVGAGSNAQGRRRRRRAS